jgi:hypothetical protein
MRVGKTEIWRAAWIVCLAALTHAAGAQTVAPDSSWHGWAFLALGPGAANADTRLAGDLGAWFTRARLALSVRTAMASRFLEPGATGDIAVLVGIHPRSDRHTDVVAGAGLGVSREQGSGGENLEARPALAFGAQANLNYAVIGIGIDAFASLADHRQIWGVGIALALGAFR